MWQQDSLAISTDGKTLELDLGEAPDGTHPHQGVYIPPGVAHGARNLGPDTARILYMVDAAQTAEPV